MATMDLAAATTEPGRVAAGGILTIDVAAIVENWKLLDRLVAPARAAAVVKADCYGLGAAAIVPRLYSAGCRTFFVAEINEALGLKPLVGGDAAFYVLNGVLPGTEGAYADAGIHPVLSSLGQCRAWAALAASGRRLPSAILQVDTGMSRLGLSVADQEALAADGALRDRLGLIMLLSHLANADDPMHAGNAQQLAAFKAARARFPGLKGSLAASAGIALSPDYHFDVCRPGAALYGIRAGKPIAGIRPVVELSVPVAQVRTIEAGASVGYGYTFRADRTMRIATVGAGYADGWRRALASKGFAYFGDHRLPILGRVSMDSFSVDLSGIGDGLVAEGDLIELIGPHQSADDVAALAGTIGYEILTSLGHRYRRAYR